MKFAVLGGSFDPFHKGHLRLAEAAIAAGYDRVIFIPALQSPFKIKDQKDSANDRLEMILASIPADRRFTVDACEIRRGGVSYTIDTLRDIVTRYTPEGKVGLIIGDDVAAEYPAWNGAEQISDIADIKIAKRTGAVLTNLSYPHSFLNNEVCAISSHETRDLIASGGEWRQFVPEGAAKIITEKKLYGYSASASAQNDAGQNAGEKNTPREGMTAAQIEDVVRPMLNVRRFIHSRNTALHCSDLARRFFLDMNAAYIAGITHDMCKGFSNEEMLSLAKKDGLPLSELEKKMPALLHGRAAAQLLRDKFGIQNNYIIEAVRYHTLEKSDEEMNPIAKLVYMCDKIEVSRTTVDNRLRDYAFGNCFIGDLDLLYKIIHKATLEYIKNNAGFSDINGD